MIVFYTEQTNVKQLVSVSCEAVCTSNCIKPKDKCCFKYKKKGINCKRCPNILLQQAS